MYHPNDGETGSDSKRKTFHICSPIGLLPIFKNLINPEDQVRDLAQELGVGPSLFLMSTRAMFWLFTLLSILNIPVFAYYYTGTSSNADGESGSKATGFEDYFVLLTLGNVGQNSFTCGKANYLQE